MPVESIEAGDWVIYYNPKSRKAYIEHKCHEEMGPHDIGGVFKMGWSWVVVQNKVCPRCEEECPDSILSVKKMFE